MTINFQSRYGLFLCLISTCIAVIGTSLFVSSFNGHVSCQPSGDQETGAASFSASLSRLGGEQVWGTLLQPFQCASDGNWEQVYENAVFYIIPDLPGQVFLRPLPLEFGYQQEPYSFSINQDRLVYYADKKGLGHNVLKVFDQFITIHGGRDLAGKPIMEPHQQKGDQTWVQCFDFYCLQINSLDDPLIEVHLLPLGKTYFEQIQVRKSSLPGLPNLPLKNGN
jgi:hypothetical protein